MRILYIDIDALRPDHLGCYGYHRNTSPNIDALAAEGARFANCHTSDAPCLPSRTALYTGMFGIHSGVVGHGGTAADLFHEGRGRSFRDRIDNEALPRKLQYAGYHTAMISPFGQRHSARQFYAGFQEIHNTGGGGMESAEEVTPLLMKWLDDHVESDNWFLHLNYWDVHTPYRAPESYGEPFKDEPLPAWITEEVWREHLKMAGPHKANEINMFDDREDPRFPRHPGSLRTREDLRRMFDGYDTAIRYVDDQIGQLIFRLKQAGVYEDTLMILSSDHGENMGELGIYGEHATADRATCRVPLLIKGPGIAAGMVDEGLHYSLDLAPTLADYLDLDHSPIWDGRSYADALTSGADCGRDQLVISQCAHVCQRSVRFGPWLYMRTYHDGFHLFPKEMLFNVEADPHEQNDLADTHPEICREGAARLLNWHDEQMASSITNVDPLWTVMREGGPLHARGKLMPYLEFLRKTGRDWAIPELERRHPRELNRVS
ncbi:MAG: sulfatase [Verrucomicrobia bacterium]|nr:sulfatase [Verrucomicrobiota bacterium]MCH8513826.1 sulfatase [Kiritimatiellia bacterium]